ncbi:MAG: hypothetical protein P1U56_01845 [Saprospiraceae bacterium]|nr:hypothetical protein [Saprospiraceae bacterium]
MKMHRQKIAWTLALLMFVETLMPLQVYALTSGPAQPEFSSFTPVGVSEMVDLFSGDFNYNIPLIEVPGPNGGYPLNLAYHSPSNYEEEASMVGLGWNINMGAITRNMRGLPDDFDGDEVETLRSRKTDWTVGVTAAIENEFFTFSGKGDDIDTSLSVIGKANISPFYNSYKGFGLKIGLDATYIPVNKGPFSLSYGTEYNTQEGLGYNGSVGLSGKVKGLEQAGLTFGFSANSMDGLKALNFNSMVPKVTKASNMLPNIQLPVNTPTYVINNTSPMSGENFTFKLLTGASLFGLTVGLSGEGYYSAQRLRFDNEWRTNKSYGYLYLQNGQNNLYATLDFNRLKDRPIKKHHQNLAIPMNTKDFYSLSAQGSSGTFCLDRDDVGIYRDKKASSYFGGGSLKGSVGGGGLFDGGVDVSLNFSESENDVKKLKAFTESNLQFQHIEANEIEEPYYFRNQADMVQNNNSDGLTGNVSTLIDNDDLIDFKIIQDDGLPLIKSYSLEENRFIKKKNGTNYNGNNSGEAIVNNIKPDRQKRSNVLKHFTWNDLNKKTLDFSNQGSPIEEGNLLPQFEINYTDKSTPGTTIPDVPLEGENSNQIAAFTELKSNGNKYNFGLPVYNLSQVEATFSVSKKTNCVTTIDIPLKSNQTSNDNGDIKDELKKIKHNVDDSFSEDLLDCKLIPRYAHSHLLTSVLGADYIDVDPTDGEPKDKDLGYWVKFKYEKRENFRWRMPFAGANYSKGLQSIGADDKAYFTFGEREQYYPQSVETSSHILEFNYAQREDNRGANGVIVQKDDELNGAHSYKLESMTLYVKMGTWKKKIRSIQFVTEYFSQQEIPNAALGKLKLKKVVFRNYNSNRGALNPYVFHYNEPTGDANIYKSYKKDRWGVFKSSFGDEECDANEFPYTRQDAGDVDASYWHLKQIDLPSGSTVTVDVSRDHYSHVQDKVACEMMQITGLEVNERDYITDDMSNSNRYKVYFKLKKNPNSGQSYPIQNYFNDLHFDLNGQQLIFKIKSQMIAVENGEDPEDYSEILTGGAYITSYGIEGEGDEEVGWVKLDTYDELNIESEDINENHPFVVTAWQFLKINLARITTDQKVVSENSTGLSKINKLLSSINSLLGTYKNFYSKADANDYGRKIILKDSYLRLNSPDKKKYGGNVKVDAIRIASEWDDEVTPEYGNVYDYTVTESVFVNNEFVDNVVSAGVAANEPTIGNEETAYKYMKHIDKDIKQSTDGLIFEEHPYNDVYFPTAHVGYRSVKVRSLASQYHYSRFLEEDDDPDNDDGPKGFSDALADELIPILTQDISSTGQAIHEFYTAKDYPVLTRESKVQSKEYWPKIIPIPFVGAIKKNGLTASQAYVVEKNDMHGKPKSVAYYGQDKSGAFLDDKVSSVEYIYHDKEIQHRHGVVSKKSRQLTNTVNLHGNYDGDKVFVGELGVHRNLELDIREHESVSQSVGGNFDVNGMLFGIFPLILPTALPDYSYKSEQMETGVSNKVISRKGILKKVIASDGTSVVETENLVYDPYTGSALVTSVNNSFDNKVYSYNVPAHQGHPRMGAAYENIGFTYTSIAILGENQKTNFLDHFCDGLIEVNLNEDVIDQLIPGDEVRVRFGNSDTGFEFSGTYEKQLDNSTALYKIDQSLITLIDLLNTFLPFNFNFPFPIFFETIRSGNRNQLNAPGQSVATLVDPTSSSNLEQSQVLDASVTLYNDFWFGNAKDPCDTDVDYDCDGIVDSEDNCIMVYNPNQIDCDGDGIGDLCEPCYNLICDSNCEDHETDWDCDGIPNGEDLCECDPTQSIKDETNNDNKSPCGALINHAANNAKLNTGTKESSKERSSGYAIADGISDYKSGVKGIFRQQSSYKYKSDRNYTESVDADGSPIRFEQKGTYSDEFKMYQWQDWEEGSNGFAFNGTAEKDKWLIGEEITNYSATGIAKESKNALDIYSAVLLTPLGVQVGRSMPSRFAHPTNVLAKVGNSRYYEAANTSFENYENTMQNYDDYPENGTHFNFQADMVSWQACEVYNIITPFTPKEEGDLAIVEVDFPFHPNHQLWGAEIELCLMMDNEGNTETIKGLIASVTSVDNNYTKITFEVTENCIGEGGNYYGRSVIIRGNDLENDIDIINLDVVPIAHTGEYSLPITTDAEFYQPLLRLVPGKQYHFSAWVSDNDAYNYNLEDNGVSIEVGGALFTPSGQKVEGWQKVEGDFTVNSLGYFIPVIEISKGDLSGTLYLDDVRLYPTEGQMESYVYDPTTFQLTHTLDDNNYFTKYIYNSDGDLISIQKETERGIKTIQENRKNLIETDE